MAHTLLSASLVIGLLASFGGPGAAPAKAATPYAKACNHYENRARFRPRGQGDFIAFLADSCSAARRSLVDGASGAAEAARFLDRVTDLFETVSAMNFARVYGDTTNPYAKPLATHGEFVPLARVTEVGEYLIAHRMGLINAFDAWAEVSPEKTLALGQ